MGSDASGEVGSLSFVRVQNSRVISLCSLWVSIFAFYLKIQYNLILAQEEDSDFEPSRDASPAMSVDEISLSEDDDDDDDDDDHEDE
jgi:hypothetical protein